MVARSEQSIHGDLAAHVAVRSAGMQWQPSPGRSVWRKRLHLVGPPEGGQVTSLVRYEPGASFPAHEHPGGEEILVLQGVFSDEHGDWPRGTYLLNPEGFRHAPRSQPGCVLFVKLRQYAGAARPHVCLNTFSMSWEAGPEPGVEHKRLYQQVGFPEQTCLERWQRDVATVSRELPGGAEVLVLAGTLSTGGEDYARGSWLRLPPGSTLEAGTGSGCTLYLKAGGVSTLQAAAAT